MPGTSTQPRGEDKFHTFETIKDAEGGIIVPQRVYYDRNTDARFIPSAIIKFSQDGHRGVFLKDAIKSDFAQSDDASASMANGNRTAVIKSKSDADKITIRIHWPGYELFGETMGIKETTNGERHIVSNAKLVHGVAKVLKKFCTGDGRFKSANNSKDSHQDWSLGRHGRYKFDQLILHELHHVSSGSYQPVLLVRTDDVLPADIGMGGPA